MFPFANNHLGWSAPLRFVACRDFVAALSLAFLSAASLSAAPFNPNNILVAIGDGLGDGSNPQIKKVNKVFEFTPTGQLVQTIPFNYNGRSYPSDEQLLDIVVDSGGAIDAMNGIDAPFLTRYFPDTNTFTHRAIADFDPLASSGFISTYRNYIFKQDAGILRIDLSTNNAVHLGGHHIVLGVATGLVEDYMLSTARLFRPTSKRQALTSITLRLESGFMRLTFPPLSNAIPLV